MKKTLLTFASALLCLGAWAQEPVEKTFNVVADTWIRTDNGGAKNGSSDKVELRTTAIADSEDFNKFVALFGFDFELPEGMKVQSATLRLVTERVKSGPVSVHGYTHNFTEGDACWNVEKDYAEPLLAAEPLTQFDVAGQYPKAIWDGGVSEEKQNVAAWTNDVDVTAYVKTLTANDSRANFMLHLPVDKVCEQVCFYTKDNTGLDLTEKYNYTATAEELAPALIVTFVEDADTNNDAIEPTADTWVRSDNVGQKKGSETAIEICYQMNDEGNARNKEFYGIMSFKMPADVVDGTYEVTSARLRLVHEMIKGDRNMEIYAYPAAIDEANACWNTEADNVAAALAAEPIATYVANGQGNKAMWDGGITDNYKTAEAWTNMIDLTDYIKANPADLNILISKRNATPGNSIKISSKETAGQVNEKNPDDIFKFEADDIKPMLYVTYTKVGGEGAGIDEIATDNANAPVEYYNLQGVRVENPANGLYIKRQGSKVEKILIR